MQAGLEVRLLGQDPLEGGTRVRVLAHLDKEYPDVVHDLDPHPLVRVRDLDRQDSNSKSRAKSEQKWGGRHSSVDPSATTILRPRFQIPSTASSLCIFQLKI